MSRVVGIFYNSVADFPANEYISLIFNHKLALAQIVLDYKNYFNSKVTMKRHLLTLAVTLACTLPVQASAAVIFSDNFDAEPFSLNTVSLANWTISNGTVDIIGIGGFDLLPGNGNYVDLDGSTSDAGKLTSSALTLVAGTTYDLVFSLGGSQRGDSNSVDFGIDADGNGVIDFLASQTLASNAPFASFNLTFTALASSNIGRIVFDHAGGDNLGLLLDNVQLRSRDVQGVPEPAALALLGLGLFGLGFARRKA